MNSNQEVLFCNDAFYQAFLNRDITVMEQVWADELPLLCIHPGGLTLSGRDRIIASWRGILGHNACPRISHKTDQVFKYKGMVLVTCYEWDERQPENILLATNGFVKEQNRYRMVFHQAGPTPLSPLDLDPDPAQPVH